MDNGVARLNSHAACKRTLYLSVPFAGKLSYLRFKCGFWASLPWHGTCKNRNKNPSPGQPSPVALNWGRCWGFIALSLPKQCDYWFARRRCCSCEQQNALEISKVSNFCSLSLSLSLSNPQSLWFFFVSRAQINQFAGPIKRKSMASLAARRPKSFAKWMLFLRRRTSSGPSTTPPKPSICRKAASVRTRRRAPRSPTHPSR